VRAVPAIAVLLLAVLAPAASAAWRPPVVGAPTRLFAVTTNPFAPGQHRGVDLGAAPGTPVRAPCAGRVAVAGRVGTSGGVVTLRCGRWRVTHLPLATITVGTGTRVAPGARLGTLAHDGAHAGLHLGVRRQGKRFGYVDPLRFLAATHGTPLPPLGRAPRGHRLPPPVEPTAALRVGPTAAPAAQPKPALPVEPPGAPLTAPRLAPGTGPLVPAAGSARRGLAPWPAWVGLALVLAGAGVRWHGGIGTRTRRRLQATVRLNE
jgi:hypothetical protein